MLFEEFYHQRRLGGVESMSARKNGRDQRRAAVGRGRNLNQRRAGYAAHGE